MKVDVSTLSNWEFDIAEVSPSFYRLRAVHKLGPSIEMSGSDYENLLSEAKAAAQKMELEIAKKVSERKRRDNSEQGRLW
ncbi:MAG TPA: hypothetical protein VGS78_04660 [Candidatus Sulfotelmatobacter sp.]|nr:hypothetical protein [Candidatus Sulfotelmatobacter sp.]